MIVAINPIVMFIVAIFCAKGSRTYGTGEVFNMVFATESRYIRTAEGLSAREA
jgi:hypothetical protein